MTAVPFGSVSNRNDVIPKMSHVGAAGQTPLAAEAVCGASPALIVKTTRTRSDGLEADRGSALAAGAGRTAAGLAAGASACAASTRRAGWVSAPGIGTVMRRARDGKAIGRPVAQTGPATASR